ncbi:PQQ-dependent sugar dehydrogenase, partial [Xanthomonas citri pv. citri]
FDNLRTASTSTMYLDLSARSQNSGERGLLGIAFHPDYAANGYVYVHYSANDGRMTVSRFTRSASNPLVADPASEQFLFQVSDFAANHNGGKIAFGPDGYLYVSFGDGGGGGDPMNYGQNLTVLFAKLLRVDVD